MIFYSGGLLLALYFQVQNTPSQAQSLSQPIQIIKSLQADLQINMASKPFKDYSLAVRLRNEISACISPFADVKGCYSSQELRSLLIQVFSFKQYEVSYELIKILSFSKSQDNNINQRQLVNYIIEKHIGQSTLNRFSFTEGQGSITKEEFLQNLAFGFSFLKGFSVYNHRIMFEQIFDQMDEQYVGIIDKQDYLDFLKRYMGRDSPMEVDPTKKGVKFVQSQELIQSFSSRHLTQQLIPVKVKDIEGQQSSIDESPPNPLEQLSNLIINEIALKCKEYDKDNDGSLTQKQTQTFFYNLLQLQYNSIDFIIQNYFNFQSHNTVPNTELTQIVCEVHFREIFSTLIQNQLQIATPNKVYMNREYFGRKLMQNCYFFDTKPSNNLLDLVFQELKAKSSQKEMDSITLEDFRSFILKYCCKKKLIFKTQPHKIVSSFIKNTPSSIVQVENSHFEQDGSQLSEAKDKQQQSPVHREQEVQELRTLSYKKTKDNKFSEQNIATLNYNSQPIVQTSSIQAISIHQAFDQDRTQKKEPEPLSFKELLWNFLKGTINKYCHIRVGWVAEGEVKHLINEEPIFGEDKLQILQQLNPRLQKDGQIEIDSLVSYTIHYKGQQALKRFSKRQIKGKSTLSQNQLGFVLQDAYGFIANNINAFQQTVQLLLSQHSSITYKEYLRAVGRHFSMKNSL